MLVIDGRACGAADDVAVDFCRNDERVARGGETAQVFLLIGLRAGLEIGECRKDLDAQGRQRGQRAVQSFTGQWADDHETWRIHSLRL